MTKKAHFLLIAVLIAGLMAPSMPVSAAYPPVKSILQKLDSLRKLDQDVSAKVSIVQTDKTQGTKQMNAVYFAKNLDDLFLIIMTGPETEKGNGYLKNGENFWMYRRNTRTFQHIARNENISGSDANAGDFETPKYEVQYNAAKKKDGSEAISDDTISGLAVYKVEIQSSLPEVDYPKKIIWVRKDNLLPLKEQSFSLSGTLMNSQYFLKYSEINGKYIPVKQLVVDEFEKGNKTLWEISDISFKKIADSVFTRSYLENLSK